MKKYAQPNRSVPYNRIISRRTAIVAGLGVAMGVATLGIKEAQFHASAADPPFNSQWDPGWTQPLSGNNNVTFAEAPAAVYAGPNELDVYNRQTGLDMVSSIAYTNNTWGSWKSISGPVVSGTNFSSISPAVIWDRNSQSYVFTLGGDHAIWMNSLDSIKGMWSGWQSLGGSCVGMPAAASWGPDRLDVCAQGTDAHIHHGSLDSTASSPAWAWEDLGTPNNAAVQFDPAMVSKGVGHLEIFVVGSDGAMYHNWQDVFAGHSSWSGWQSLGGVCLSGPGAASWGLYRLDACMIGTDNAIWHTWWDGGTTWHPWESLGGLATSAPALASPYVSPTPVERLDVFVVGSDNTLWRRSLIPQ